MTQSHTPTPYIYLDAYQGIYDMPDARGAQVRIAEIVRTSDYEANAAFIVRACNAHDDLVNALEDAETYLEQYASRGSAKNHTLAKVKSALALAKAAAQ